MTLEPGEEARIRSLLPKVRDPRVRDTAESLLDGRNQMIPAIEPLVEALKLFGRRRHADMVTAAWSLGFARLTPPQTQSAASVLASNVTALQWRASPYAQLPVPFAPPGIRFMWMPVLGIFVWAFFFWESWRRELGTALWIIPPAFFIMAVITAVRFDRMQELYMELTRSLGNLAAPTHAGELAEVYKQFVFSRRLAEYHMMFHVAEAALINTLNAAAASPGELFTQETVQSLTALLRQKDNRILIAVLNALAVRGQPGAVLAIESVRARTKNEDVRLAAEAAAAALVERQRNIEHSRTLLRSAGAGHMGGDLLRPAESGRNAEASLPRTLESAGETSGSTESWSAR